MWKHYVAQISDHNSLLDFDFFQKRATCNYFVKISHPQNIYLDINIVKL